MLIFKNLFKKEWARSVLAKIPGMKCRAVFVVKYIKTE